MFVYIRSCVSQKRPGLTSNSTCINFLLYLIGKSESSPEFGPSINEFVRRFDTASTNGQGIYIVCCTGFMLRGQVR